MVFDLGNVGGHGTGRGAAFVGSIVQSGFFIGGEVRTIAEPVLRIILHVEGDLVYTVIQFVCNFPAYGTVGHQCSLTIHRIIVRIQRREAVTHRIRQDGVVGGEGGDIFGNAVKYVVNTVVRFACTIILANACDGVHHIIGVSRVTNAVANSVDDGASPLSSISLRDGANAVVVDTVEVPSITNVIIGGVEFSRANSIAEVADNIGKFAHIHAIGLVVPYNGSGGAAPIAVGRFAVCQNDHDFCGVRPTAVQHRLGAANSGLNVGTAARTQILDCFIEGVLSIGQVSGVQNVIIIGNNANSYVILCSSTCIVAEELVYKGLCSGLCIVHLTAAFAH